MVITLTPCVLRYDFYSLEPVSISSSRDWRFLLSCFVIPLALTAASMGVAKLRPDSEEPPLAMAPSLYGPDSASYVAFDESSR